ncbi:MAG TPA: beta-ketoacyl-ACP synthase II [Longimicrobiaceae bacterium]|nr:beta-ketoacyl-ACP synthase II [Longimicrobiaceae bacterium]
MTEALQEGAPDHRAAAPRRVVVTGIGCVTPIGAGVEGLWDGLHRRRSAVRRLDRFDPSPFRSHIAAQVDDFDPADYMDRSRVRRTDRYSQFAIASTRQALEDAELDAERLDGDRVAVQFGSALAGVGYAEAQLGEYFRGGVRAVNPLVALAVFGGAASCNVAIEFGFTGPNSTNGMSCASGAMALGEGWRFVRAGVCDVAVAGGVEAPLAPLCYGAFAIIRAMSTRNDDPERASRPFDADRDGFVMGEGAAVLVLEEMEHARARGARVYAELLGYATTNDAHHMTAPRPDGRQAARAMRGALRAAGVRPDQIEYVNAHGSATPLNDSTESRVIREVLGDHADEVAVSGTKGYHAHALGATGAIEAAITALALHRGWIPPTLNLDEPAPDCDLPYVRGCGLERSVDYAISNSFGFGGINAALVFGRTQRNQSTPSAL